MRYVVEVPVAEDDLHEQMNRMRGWLDHRRFEPRSFRLSRAGNRQVVRVLFKTENEALAFAAEFRGLLLSSVPEAAIA
jgi:hypothetical protein